MLGTAKGLAKAPGQHQNASSVLNVTNLVQLEVEAADGALPKMVHGYYASGSETESAMRDNRQAYERYRLIPRMLVDVSNLNTATRILGCHLSFPVLVAPMAMQQMAHPDGELAVAHACKACGTNMIVSTMANYSLDEVAQDAGPDHLWFQLYVFRDRGVVRTLVQDAERAGYRALVVTVDAPFLGNREADVRNRFRMPDGLVLSNAQRVADVAARGGKLDASSGSGIANLFVNSIDDSLTWELVSFLKTITSLPIIVKGVLHPRDAELAVHHGASGIVVSNHGGRQLDYAVAAIDVIGAISAAVRGRVPLLMDGGIRRGTDVLKALALGADAVLLGRPVLYGLSKGGQQGVQEVLDILKAEFQLAMALAGCNSVADLSCNLVVHESSLPLRSML